MPKFRVEVEERTTISREKWFTADDIDDARYQADREDWREWAEVDSTADTSIVHVEEVTDDDT